jgi:hypothetical protein
MVRWYLSRHGETVFADWPGLLARLAQGPADVALLFEADRAAGLLAWRPGARGSAELLADHLVVARHRDPARLKAFAYGTDGPLGCDGIVQIWLVADAKQQVKRLQAEGYRPAGPALRGPGHDGVIRLERSIGQAGQPLG